MDEARMNGWSDEQKEAAKKVYYSEKMRYNRAKRKKG